jgi:hypothetical protein
MKPLPPVIMTLFKIPEIILGSYIFYINEISNRGFLVYYFGIQLITETED